MEKLQQSSDSRNITVVFKSENGHFIATLEMQNVAFPYLENAKTRKTYLERLNDIQQEYERYQVDFWVSRAQGERKYEKALSEIYEVKITSVSFLTQLRASA